MITRQSFKRWITHVHSPRVEELLKQAATSNVISFAGALPDEDLFPAEDLQRAFEHVMAHQAAEALQYNWSEGYEPLREQIAARMSARGRPTCAAEVLVTHGAQQALDLLGKLTLNHGDTAALETPTYNAAIQALELQQPVFAAIPRTVDGLELDALDAALERAPRLLYLVPTGHNPTGATLTSEQRRAILDRLGRFKSRGSGALLIEDDAYGDLQYEHPETPMAFMPGGENQIAYVGSFSKVLSPGLRVGWIVARKDAIAELSKIKQATDLQTGTLNQLVLSHYLEAQTLDAHIARCVAMYRMRRDRLRDAMRRVFPASVRWSRPTAGFSLWVELPAGVNAALLLDEAVRRGVAFEPGRPFFPCEHAQNYMRLSFSNLSEDNIEYGVQRLATLL